MIEETIDLFGALPLPFGTFPNENSGRATLGSSVRCANVSRDTRKRTDAGACMTPQRVFTALISESSVDTSKCEAARV